MKPDFTKGHKNKVLSPKKLLSEYNKIINIFESNRKDLFKLEVKICNEEDILYEEFNHANFKKVFIPGSFELIISLKNSINILVDKINESVFYNIKETKMLVKKMKKQLVKLKKLIEKKRFFLPPPYDLKKQETLDPNYSILGARADFIEI